MKEAPVLSDTFRILDRRLLFARARLYRDRLELRGWSWRGRYRQTITLNEVQHVKWWPVSSGVNLTIDLGRGEEVNLYFEAPGNWKYALEDRLKQNGVARPELPERHLADAPKSDPPWPLLNGRHPDRVSRLPDPTAWG